MGNFHDMALRVAAGAQKIYRVITDEPQGVAVGFIPSQDALDQLGAAMDEWDLVGDDGSDDGDPILTGNKNDVIVRSESQRLTDEEREAGMSELGMDMRLWRDEASMLEDLTPGG